MHLGPLGDARLDESMSAWTVDPLRQTVRSVVGQIGGACVPGSAAMIPTPAELADVRSWLATEVYVPEGEEWRAPRLVDHPLDVEGVMRWVLFDYQQRYRFCGISHEQAKHRIYSEIQQIIVPTPPVDPPQTGTGSKASVLGKLLPIHGDFLNGLGDFEKDGSNFTVTWVQTSRDEYVRRLDAYRARGFDHLVMDRWGKYHGNPAPLSLDEMRWRVQAALDRDLVPIVFVLTDGRHGSGSESEARDEILQQVGALKDLVPIWSLGWELPQIADWLREGDAQGRLLHYLIGLTDQTDLVAVHWSPERWSGWPNYGSQDTNPNAPNFDKRSEDDWWAKYRHPRLLAFWQAPPQPGNEKDLVYWASEYANGNRVGGAMGRIRDIGGVRVALFECCHTKASADAVHGFLQGKEGNRGSVGGGNGW